MAVGHKRSQEVKKRSPIQQGVEVTVCLRYSAPHPWLCISMRWSNQVIAITIWTKKKVTMMMMMMMMLIWPWQKTCGWCTSAWDCRPPQIPAIFEFYKFWCDLKRQKSTNQTQQKYAGTSLKQIRKEDMTTWLTDWERREANSWLLKIFRLQPARGGSLNS